MLETKDTLKYDALATQREILEEDHDITIFDVGANEGQTVRHYRNHFPNAKFYCFEPTQIVAERLKRNFSNDNRVAIIHKAVTDRVGTVEFYQRETNSATSRQSGTNSLFQRPESGKQHYMEELPKQKTNVESTTLDSFLNKEEISNVNILKIDVEGAELLVLKGSQKSLSEQLFDLIYLEVSFVERWRNSPLFWDIWRFLELRDYKLFNLYNLRRAENGQLRFGDALFVTNSLHK